MSQARELWEYFKTQPPSARKDPEVWRRFKVALVIYTKSPFGHYKITTWHCEDDSSIRSSPPRFI